MTDYDSRVDTYEHINEVRLLIDEVIKDLIDRALFHDESKLHSPEKETFDEFTPKLKNTTYGSPEYSENLAGMKVALEHHYRNNSHHPEYHVSGIKGMTLIDVIEMLCDWKAATLRHADGDILKSINQNQQRFGYSDDLKFILLNTVEDFGWDTGNHTNIKWEER